VHGRARPLRASVRSCHACAGVRGGEGEGEGGVGGGERERERERELERARARAVATPSAAGTAKGAATPSAARRGRSLWAREITDLIRHFVTPGHEEGADEHGGQSDANDTHPAQHVKVRTTQLLSEPVIIRVTRMMPMPRQERRPRISNPAPRHLHLSCFVRISIASRRMYYMPCDE
jgi:hypothetical protein